MLRFACSIRRKKRIWRADIRRKWSTAIRKPIDRKILPDTMFTLLFPVRPIRALPRITIAANGTWSKKTARSVIRTDNITSIIGFSIQKRRISQSIRRINWRSADLILRRAERIGRSLRKRTNILLRLHRKRMYITTVRLNTRLRLNFTTAFTPSALTADLRQSCRMRTANS